MIKDYINFIIQRNEHLNKDLTHVSSTNYGKYISTTLMPNGIKWN